jgi:CRISPR-associated protein Cas2
MKHWVAVYDIADDRRRVKLARILDDFGCRVQRSVFEITATDAELELLCRRIQRIIHPAEDSVRFYAQCAACVEKVMDLGISHEKPFDMPEVIVV